MAIKKRPVSPRQKMINLMYVILMAMLALNTPTDEEFGVKGKSIVEKIKKSLADDGKKSDVVWWCDLQSGQICDRAGRR